MAVNPSVQKFLHRINDNKTEFRCRWKKISDVEVEMFCERLNENQSITEVDLSCNAIKTEGARCLTETLKKNETIQVLNLSGNSLGDEGAAVIGSALEINKSLKTLDVSVCRIGKEGALGIAKGLKNNSGLRALRMDTDPIGTEGVVALGDALGVNHTLKYLSLVDVELDDEGWEALGKLVKRNDGLEVLELDAVECSKKGVMIFKEAMMINMEKARGLERLVLDESLFPEMEVIVEGDRVKKEWSRERHWRYRGLFRDQVLVIMMMWNCEGTNWNEMPIEVVLRVIKYLAVGEVPHVEQWIEEEEE